MIIQTDDRDVKRFRTRTGVVAARVHAEVLESKTSRHQPVVRTLATGSILAWTNVSTGGERDHLVAQRMVIAPSGHAPTAVVAASS